MVVVQWVGISVMVIDMCSKREGKRGSRKVEEEERESNSFPQYLILLH